MSRTIDSFLKLNLKDCQIVVIDHGTTVHQKNKNELFNLNYIKKKYENHKNVIIHCEKEKISWEDQFSLYLSYSKDFKYFSIISDDDFFLKNNCIAQKIEILNNDSKLSFVMSSAYMFELSNKNYWKRNFTNKSGRYSGKNFIEKFIKEESLQHSTVTGIFRIKNMIKTNCFSILEKIKENKLQAGYGLDTRFYFRNASLGEVMIIGNFKTRAIRFHNDGMTYKQPVESSYCYYWNIVDNFNYLESKKIYLENKNIYLQMWIKNLLGSHIINIFFVSQEYNYPKILSLLKVDYIKYIESEISKNEIKVNPTIKKLIFYNKILKYLPKSFLVKTNDHFIPKNLLTILFNTKVFYPFSKFLTKLNKKFLFKRLKNLIKRF